MIIFNTGNYKLKHSSIVSNITHLVPENFEIPLCQITIRKQFIKSSNRISNIIKKDVRITFQEIIREPAKFCPKCYGKLLSLSLNQKIESFESWLKSNKKLSVSDKNGEWRTTKCPECETPVIFFNKSGKKEHHCTVCNEIVTLPKEAIA